MKDKLLTTVSLIASLLTLGPTALASTTWYVNGVSGSDNNNCTSPTTACKTIGHAISLATSGDAITVAAATYKENLTIGVSLTVIGSGASTTVIDGGGIGRVLAVSSSAAHVTLSKLALNNGVANYGGGISNIGTLTIGNCIIAANLANGAQAPGGGIYNGGTLTVNYSVISGNHAMGRQTASSFGAGIYTTGTLTINHSSIIGNSTSFISGGGGIFLAGGKLTINSSDISVNASFFGGGIEGRGVLTIRSSTLINNRASFSGGGISNAGTLRIINSTLSGNTAFKQSGGAISNGATLAISSSTLSGNSAVQGGGVFNNGGTAILQNSIVANSPSGGDCSGTITSHSYNLSSDNTCHFSNVGDLNNTNPKLGTLGNYGGPTQTIPLLSGSPATDAGNPAGCTDGQGHLLKTDQRGKPRPDPEDTGGCDMGAYERQTD